MNFTPHTQEELKEMEIKDGHDYRIEYVDRDYFNGIETIDNTHAKAIINDGDISFVVKDAYGMDKFIKDVRVV